MIAKLRARKRSSTSGCMIMFTSLAYAAPLGGTGEQSTGKPAYTLHDVVKAGKVRYLGASSMNAWQFAKMQHAADLNGWTRFVAMQDQYNLIKREEEREMLPMCADMGVGCVPYSPQGKGRLTRPWGTQTDRSAVDVVAKSFDLDVDQPVVDSVQRVAESRGIRCRRSRWPGCWPCLSCRRRSSEPPSRTTSRTPPPRSRSP